MQNASSVQTRNLIMAIKKHQDSQAKVDRLPEIILLKSENPTIDTAKRAEEVRYYLTQIILLADKRGRPSKNQMPEVTDAA
jgi:hypothetical protein